ncbi:MAG: molybdopterin-dependent oxidoreductase, partial [Chitinophagales bacterium]
RKHPGLIIHTTEPLNAEPPLKTLSENFITPVELFYVRNHGNIPDIDAKSFRLRIDGLAERNFELPLEDLQNNFPKRSVMATVQCAGNRRNQLIDVSPIPDEVPWKEGAIGNTIWSGVPLKAILSAAGIKSEVRHVAFLGADKVIRNEENVGFGSSIPVEKAMSDEVLLAYEMNGAPLEPIHGFPLRLIVPGYIGARSVKWLKRITLQEQPSENYFQARTYQLFPPHINREAAESYSGIQLGELGVNCVITSPTNNFISDDESITVNGYALSSGGRKIVRVDLSSNGGKSWVTANITHEGGLWAWCFWETQLILQKGEHDIVARAFDSAVNTQPEDPRHTWNFKGYMNNAWHRVKIIVNKQDK